MWCGVVRCGERCGDVLCMVWCGVVYGEMW